VRPGVGSCRGQSRLSADTAGTAARAILIRLGMTMNEHHKTPTVSPWLSLWRKLGPGLVTGAADDDPSGIATHSQIGAQFGFGLSWTFVFSFPLMVVIQQVAAEIGSALAAERRGGVAARGKHHQSRS
jgi:hypothetical protein